MTISSTTVRNSYSGDGTTDTFTYNFKIFQDSDIQVIIRSANGSLQKPMYKEILLNPQVLHN
jgi:hypothetical protein